MPCSSDLLIDRKLNIGRGGGANERRRLKAGAGAMLESGTNGRLEGGASRL